MNRLHNKQKSYRKSTFEPYSIRFHYEYSVLDVAHNMYLTKKKKKKLKYKTTEQQANRLGWNLSLGYVHAVHITQC